tara:strand:- start:673 stop:1101 length:429 start_codon:yes stop_codon:yes gene_type:complete
MLHHEGLRIINMNITIVKEDRLVAINGEGIKFDFVLPANVWAIQWDGTKGAIEFTDGTPNEFITDFTAYQHLVEGHATEKQRLVDAEVQAEATRVANLTYADKRAAAYPSIADQLDDIYHNGVEGWKATIQAVKDTYPKGGN